MPDVDPIWAKMSPEERFNYFLGVVMKELPPVPTLIEEPQIKSYNFLAFHLRTRAFASILYVQDLSETFASIANFTQHPNAGVLFARAFAELAAINYYLRKNVGDCYRAGNMKSALEWSLRSLRGNRYLRGFTEPPPGVIIPEPIDIAKATKCYSKDVLKEPKQRQDYELLSEATHPNGAALSPFLEFNHKERKIAFTREPKAENSWTNLVVEYGARAVTEILEMLDLAAVLDEKFNETHPES